MAGRESDDMAMSFLPGSVSPPPSATATLHAASPSKPAAPSSSQAQGGRKPCAVVVELEDSSATTRMPIEKKEIGTFDGSGGGMMLLGGLGTIIRSVRTHGPRAWLRENRAVAAMASYVVAYLAIGCIFYTQYEDWSFTQALYFCLSTIATVGYGDVVASDNGSRIFTCFYIVGGFGLFTLALGTRLRAVATQSQLVQNHQRIEDLLYGPDGKNEMLRANRRRKALISLGKQCLAFLLLLGIGTLFFSLHNGFEFVPALYIAVTTGSTVGTGDISPAKLAHSNSTVGGAAPGLSHGGMVFAIFYIPIFVVFALNLLSWMASHVYYVSLTHAVSASMKGALTDRLLLALDADHNNRVDRLEWLMSVLLSNNVVSENLLNIILQRFDALDVDNSGYLDHADIETVRKSLDAVG